MKIRSFVRSIWNLGDGTTPLQCPHHRKTIKYLGGIYAVTGRLHTECKV